MSANHVIRAMRELIAARDWLTVYPLSAYAPELNLIESYREKAAFASGANST